MEKNVFSIIFCREKDEDIKKRDEFWFLYFKFGLRKMIIYSNILKCKNEFLGVYGTFFGFKVFVFIKLKIVIFFIIYNFLKNYFLINLYERKQFIHNLFNLKKKLNLYY